ncbi:MAG: hypothetical protein KGD60_09690 [Candidatus Thorarchaeota archaeon]|nr:hypothetical protein [Candidatus Thorarchaeota archaeon]
MRGLQRALVKVLILVPLAVLASLFAIAGGIVSYTPATRVGVHSVLVFWISIPTALAVLAYRRKPIRANAVMNSALIFAIVLHGGSAAKNMFRLAEDSVDRVLVDTAGDLLEFALYGVLLAGAMVCFIQKQNDEKPQATNRLIVSFILIMPLVIYGAMMLIIPALPPGLLMSVGLIIGAIAVAGFLIASILTFRHPSETAPFDQGYFASALLLFLVATIATMTNLADPSMNWEYAETLQMAAFLLLCLALGVPFLKKSGFRRRSAYGVVVGLILMAYLPFLLTIVLESLTLPPFFEPLNLLAYSIIHIGAASLSGMMAILLYIYPKKKPSWNHFPLVLLFGLWAAISLILVVIFTVPEIALLGEPIIPFVVGSITTLGLLVFAILWTAFPPTERKIPSIQRLAIILSFLILLVVIGETLNQVAINAIPAIADSPYGALVLLGSNLAIMFTFTYLIFLLAEKSSGKPPVEIYITFFLGMWILPNILKSFYGTWTPGWWVSEVLLFVGLLAGPPLLIWLYVRSMREVQESHSRASLYADLLMHDVSNYNQMVMTTLELLGSSEISKERRERLADDGCKVISFSEQLISNVRLLSESDQLEFSRLEPTNLVSTIVSALDLFALRVGSEQLKLEFKPGEVEAFVMANELLVHIFLNILYTALECGRQGETVTLSIQSIEQGGEDFWLVLIKAPAKVIGAEEEFNSDTLGLTAAELITESLNGHFEVEKYERVDECEGRLYTIRLHVANE